MHNMPDDIGNYKCTGCKEIIPNCVCEDLHKDSLFAAALTGDEADVYIGMFNSIDFDDLVMILRDYHANSTEENSNDLINKLDTMLVRHIDTL